MTQTQSTTNVPNSPAAHANVRGSALPFGLAGRARHATEQPISYLLQAARENPDLISLAAGLVDYRTLPGEQVRMIVDELMAERASAEATLQYGTTEGLPELRQELFAHMARLDGVSTEQMPGSPEQVLVTNGSQQLLHILTDLLVDQDDIVFMDWPSYFVYTAALNSFNAQVRCADSDEQGLRPDLLARQLEALEKLGLLPRVKIIYTCSYYQNPTGLTLDAERRRDLLEVVKRFSKHHRILLLEDAAYRELYYDDPPPHSMLQHDPENAYVAVLQTFSKPFAPGIKLGYGLLPADLTEPARLSKGGRDFGSPTLCQRIALRAMQNGMYAEHVELLRKTYASKRDAMLDALEQELGALRGTGAKWTTPGGGLYVWLTLPEGVDTGADGPLFSTALNQGVLFVPGAYCFPNDPVHSAPRNTIRLSFGVPTEENIREGIARLAAAVRRVME